jgi:VIT1/CCC1 family predicted Fe2+/Mn2+ transporter
MTMIAKRDIEKKILKAQKSEITEYLIYRKLSRSVKNSHNRDVLGKISEDELNHYSILQNRTGKAVRPSPVKVRLYYVISKFFGLTFGLKLMEKAEERALQAYKEISAILPQAQAVMSDEDKHEHQLLQMIDEERLNYVGAIVRGLNGAIVELTGALSGLTLAFRNPQLIAAAGLITGTAMCLSLSSTEYLATKTEGGHHHPLKAAFYTALANIITVALLIFPYLVFPHIYLALVVMLADAIIVIGIFNFYISVARNMSFKTRVGEMILISLGISGLTFAVGFLIRPYFGINLG